MLLRWEAATHLANRGTRSRYANEVAFGRRHVNRPIPCAEAVRLLNDMAHTAERQAAAINQLGAVFLRRGRKIISRPRNGGAQAAEAVPEGYGNTGGVDGRWRRRCVLGLRRTDAEHAGAPAVGDARFVSRPRNGGAQAVGYRAAQWRYARHISSRPFIGGRALRANLPAGSGVSRQARMPRLATIAA
jgi:hypothetical protein